MRIGRFRCEVGHPDFRDTGPIRQAVVVFPRTSVWIRHEGAREFVADPNVVTIYNRGQRYERFPIHPAGDRCDWIALSDEFARDVASWQTPAAAESRRASLRLRRALPGASISTRGSARSIRRAAAGQLSVLEAEEESIAIVGEVLALARDYATRTHESRRADAARRRRDLAEAARAELARAPFENRSVADLARALQTSPYHLCRVFKEETGQTMHAYRVGIRLRNAIDRLSTVAGRAPGGLSAIAHETGFASHAHLVQICRRELGMTPTALRARLG